VQFDPEVVALNRQKDELWKQRKELRLDNPKGVEILHQIKELEDKIGAIAADADDGTMKLMQNHLLAAEGMDLFALDQKIRTQEILLEELAKRYADQLAKSADRSESAVDISFDMTQLARTNKTIDQIDDRILAIQAEARAPGQINQLTKAITSPYKRWWLLWWWF
jgi:dGTP triphosphohydrolase